MKNIFKKNQLMITAMAIMIAIAGYLQFAGEDLEDEYLAVNDENVYTSDAGDEEQEGEDNFLADGLLSDLSDEDLIDAELLASLTEIESLDSDVDIIVDDYLAADMEVSGNAVEGTDVASKDTVTDGAAVASNDAEGVQTDVAEATPEEDEIPGEAVFTSTAGVAMISEAKLLKEQTRAKNKETLLEIINSTGITDEQKQEAVETMVEMTAIAEKEAAAEILLESKGFEDVVVSVNGDSVDVVVNEAVLDDAMRAQIEDIVKRKTEVSAENIIISTVVQ
mgnify:FL=1